MHHTSWQCMHPHKFSKVSWVKILFWLGHKFSKWLYQLYHFEQLWQQGFVTRHGRINFIPNQNEGSNENVFFLKPLKFLTFSLKEILLLVHNGSNNMSCSKRFRIIKYPIVCHWHTFLKQSSWQSPYITQPVCCHQCSKAAILRC